jgi:hypothetical protein
MFSPLAASALLATIRYSVLLVRVPFSAGTVSSMMRLSAAMTPLMLPPSSGRMTG